MSKEKSLMLVFSTWLHKFKSRYIIPSSLLISVKLSWSRHHKNMQYNSDFNIKLCSEINAKSTSNRIVVSFIVKSVQINTCQMVQTVFQFSPQQRLFAIFKYYLIYIFITLFIDLASYWRGQHSPLLRQNYDQY